MVTPSVKNEGRDGDLTHAGRSVEVGGRPALALPGPPGLPVTGHREPAQHLQCEPPSTQYAARRSAGTGRGQDEPAHARRMVKRETQSDAPAHGVAGYYRSLDPKHVEKAFCIVGHLLDGVGARRLVAPTSASGVERNHLTVDGKRSDDPAEQTGVGSEPGNEEQRWTSAMVFVVQLDAVDVRPGHAGQVCIN
jgi:hypothetical protein